MMHLEFFIKQQMEWSEKTFGPGKRTEGILDHISKEIQEVRNAPEDLEEWVDLIILALDGAWRSGYPPDMITGMMRLKASKNRKRSWPDWRTAETGKAIEHTRDEKSELPVEAT